MLDDADVAEVINWQYEKQAQKAIQGLEKNNIHAEYAANRSEALSKLIASIHLCDYWYRGFCNLASIVFISGLTSKQTHCI
jgi:hypothetical protein